MLGRLVLISIRNLRRNLLYTLIVIGGLSLGMSTFLSIMEWSAWHYSYDRHFENAENIFRLSLEEKRENFERHTARILHGNITQQIIESTEIPQIKQISRLAPFRNAIVKRGDMVFYEDKSFACDPGFLELFEPSVLQGDPQSMLDGPFKLVLTRTLATKYFGDEDPIGQSLELVHQFGVTPDKYEITGVIEDYPSNSHFSISLLTSFDDPANYTSTAWVYLRLMEGTDCEKVEETIKEVIRHNNSESFSEGLFPHLHKVTNIHLKSHLAREIGMNVNHRSVLIISFAGLLVFILAWFNFTLLSVSQNQLNLKKLIFQWQMGAGKRAFFYQFFVDFMVVGLISLLISAILIIIVGQQVSSIMGGEFSENPGLLLLGFSGFIILIVLTSALTAWYATYRLYRILKLRYLSSSSLSTRSYSGRNIFVQVVILVEFVITFILISNLFMIREQVNYAIAQQIGSKDYSTIQIPNLPRPVIDKYSLFRNEIQQHPEFSGITGMMEEPGGMAMDAFNFTLEGMPSAEDRLFVFPVDEYFLQFYNLRLLTGSNFPMSYQPEDTVDYYILNETAAKAISPGDYEKLLGRTLNIEYSIPGFFFPGKIIGIVEDFHLSTMEMAVNPMVIFPKHVWLYCYSLRIQGDRQKAIQKLNSIWKEIYPDYPLRYYFTSELYENLYSTEIHEVKVLILFSILSLLIAGTGLFSLSGYFMHLKLRAAAIRKINGAGIRHILFPELRQYLVLALVSTLIAAPISYLTISKWLSNFSYQVEVQWWIIPAAASLLIGFSWLAILYNAMKLARINPSEHLGRE